MPFGNITALFMLLSFGVSFGTDRVVPSLERQRSLILGCSPLLQKLVPHIPPQPFSNHPFFDANGFSKAQSFLPAVTTDGVMRALKSINYNGLDVKLSFSLVSSGADVKAPIKGWFVKTSKAERPGSSYSYDVHFINEDAQPLVLPIESIEPKTLEISHIPLPVPKALQGKSLSFIADNSGIAGFEHSTANEESLVEILKDGLLRPISGDTGIYPHKPLIGPRAVYFYPFAKGVPIRSDLQTTYSSIRLIFACEILDEQDHYYNPRQTFGAASASSILSKDTEYYPRMLYILGKQVWQGGEFVFPDAISTSRLKAIVVPPGKREEILQLLRQKLGAATLSDRRRLDSLVVEKYQVD